MDMYVRERTVTGSPKPTIFRPEAGGPSGSSFRDAPPPSSTGSSGCRRDTARLARICRGSHVAAAPRSRDSATRLHEKDKSLPHERHVSGLETMSAASRSGCEARFDPTRGVK